MVFKMCERSSVEVQSVWHCVSPTDYLRASARKE